MPDNDVKTENEGEKTTFTKDEVEALLKKRLIKQGTQLSKEKEALEQQLAAMQQAQPQDSVGMEGAAVSAGNPQVPLSPEQPMVPPAQGTGTPPGAQTGVTPEDMKRLLSEHQQQLSANQAIQYSDNEIAKMRDEDKKFSELADNKESFGIPGHAVVKIVNHFPKDRAKQLLTELLTNEGMNLKMQNHMYAGKFNEWIKKILSTPTSTDETSPKSVPDLSNQGATEGLGTDDENLENFMSSRR